MAMPYLKLLQELLACPHCLSNLNFDKISGDSAFALRGSVYCSSCGFQLNAEKGVLCASSFSNSKHQRRVSEVYTELWNRLGDELEHSPVKEEQILIDGWAALISNKIVADIGAGNGRLGHHWYRLGATAIVFVDPSFAIFRCAQKFGSNGTPSLFLQADITALPLKDKSMEFVWCGGTLGLIENQKQGQLELQRISSETLLLSVLTEKRWVPRLYLWGNVIKPLVNRVKHFDLLFACCGVLSKFIWRTLRALRTLPYVNQRWLVGQIGELLESPMGWKRLQLALYDPILIPKIWKHKDDYYQSIAQTAGFNLASHRTLLLCDYFEFVRTK